jgi:sugar phosphate isomerase/epimerase
VNRRAALLCAAALAGCGEPARCGDTLPFGAFNLAIETRPVAAQAELLDRLGYCGVTFWHSAATLDEYRAQRSVPITAVFFMVDAANPDHAAIPAIVASITSAGALPWLIVGGPASIDRARLIDVVREVAGAAAGATVVIYPHAGTAIPSAEAALEVMQQAGRSNLKLSLHLSHELKAGNQQRLPEVIARSAPHAALASINGADVERELLPDDYAHTIKPLAEGTLDVERLYLRPLLDAGYTGPVLLHTFGLAQSADTHLEQSLARWRQMIAAR